MSFAEWAFCVGLAFAAVVCLTVFAVQSFLVGRR